MGKPGQSTPEAVTEVVILQNRFAVVQFQAEYGDTIPIPPILITRRKSKSAGAEQLELLK
jgi:hypothetical protein